MLWILSSVSRTSSPPLLCRTPPNFLSLVPILVLVHRFAGPPATRLAFDQSSNFEGGGAVRLVRWQELERYIQKPWSLNLSARTWRSGRRCNIMRVISPQMIDLAMAASVHQDIKRKTGERRSKQAEIYFTSKKVPGGTNEFTPIHENSRRRSLLDPTHESS